LSSLTTPSNLGISSDRSTSALQGQPSSTEDFTSRTPVTNVINQSTSQPSLAGTDLQKLAQEGTAAQQVAGISKYANQDYVAPEYTNEDFFPGRNEPIRVGGYTGKTIGSVDFFVPTGQYVPFNIIAKRERALDEARKARAERKAKYKDPTAPSISNPKFNENLQKSYYEGLERIKGEAKAKYGEYAVDALQDPTSEEYTAMQRHQNTYNWLAGNSESLIKNAAEVIEQVERGDDTSYSKGAVEAAYAIQNGFAYGANPEELVAQGKRLEGYRNIETNLKESQFFKDLLPNISAKIIDGDGYVTEQESKSWKDQIQKEAE